MGKDVIPEEGGGMVSPVEASPLAENYLVAGIFSAARFRGLTCQWSGLSMFIDERIFHMEYLLPKAPPDFSNPWSPFSSLPFPWLYVALVTGLNFTKR